MATRQQTISSAVVKIASYNKKRTSILIQNIGGANVFIAEDQKAPASDGIRLGIGDVFSRVASLGGQPELNLYAIRDTIDVTIAIVEDFGKVQKEIEAPA